MHYNKQIHREIRWTLYITLFYLIGWITLAYLSPSEKGILGFPIWFELTCLYLPSLLILLIWIVIKYLFQEIDLEGKQNE